MFPSICRRGVYLLNHAKICRTMATTMPSTAQVASPTNAINDEQNIKDEFTIHFEKNHIETSPLQRLLLGAGSSIAALLDPRRHDMIACLGETTSESALLTILYRMQSSEEGRRILSQKPRINTKTIDLQQLSQLPDNTLGKKYVNFLKENNVTPDSRLDVCFIDDAQLAYIMTRYRECHDLIHTVLDMPTNMLGEVAVKWIEALNLGLPMCYGGAVFGAVRLRNRQRQEYLKRYLPWAIENGNKMKHLMTVYWEERWNQNIDDLRRELNITILQ